MMNPSIESSGNYLKAITRRAIDEFPRKKWEEILEIINVKYASKCQYECNIIFYNRQQNYNDVCNLGVFKRPHNKNNEIYFKNFSIMMIGDLYGNNIIDIIKTHANGMIVEINVINLADHIKHKYSNYLPGGYDEENKFVYEVYFNWS